jgi:predicted Zn-ribbon and HTH transcriptional regulator
MLELAYVIFALVAVALLITLRRRRRRGNAIRFEQKKCVKCGYDIRFNVRICPECGDDLVGQVVNYYRDRLDPK